MSGELSWIPPPALRSTVKERIPALDKMAAGQGERGRPKPSLQLLHRQIPLGLQRRSCQPG